jgi:hypothetical protein
MSHFLKIEKIFYEAHDSIIEELEEIFSAGLRAALVGCTVKLRVIPPGDGYSYERWVVGTITDATFWMSNPEWERSAPFCKIHVLGQDQFGRQFSGQVSPNQIDSDLPWEKFSLGGPLRITKDN